MRSESQDLFSATLRKVLDMASKKVYNIVIKSKKEKRL